MGKLTECKDCGHQISKKADKCPNCGSPQKMSKGKSQALGCLGWIIIIFFVVMIWPESDDSESTRSESPKVSLQEQDNKSMAYVMCENWVKDRLKSPSTAEFPSVFSGKLDNVYKDGTTYSVTSYVDSENSFGATLRTGFTCETTQTSEDEWMLESLEFDD